MSSKDSSIRAKDKKSDNNASSQGFNDEAFGPAANKQLLDERAEKYLRESANIEDLPDAAERNSLDDKEQE